MSTAPAIRPGVGGLVDRWIGPGASPGVRAAVVLAALGGAGLGAFTGVGPPATAALLALASAELCAGLLIHLSPPGRRWAGRPAHRPLRLAGDVVLVAAHLGLVTVLFQDGDGRWFAVAAGILAAAAAAVALVPVHWRRQTGLAVMLAGLLLLRETVGAVPDAPWFVPLLYARVLIARLPAVTGQPLRSESAEPG
jgi:hypothetical protein